MTYNDFIQSFNTKFYALTTVDNLGWKEDEICHFLNSAQYKLLNQLDLAKQFELIPSLIRKITITPSVPDSIGRYEAELPDDYYNYISGVAFFTKNEESLKTDIEFTEYRLLNQFISNPLNKTLFLQPKAAIVSRGKGTPIVFTPTIIVVVDSYTTALPSLELEYIKKPEEFNSATSSITDMDLRWHDDIVNMAVEIATSTVIKTAQTSQ